MGRVIMSGIVPLLSVPVKGTALSKLDEGTIIKINEGGSPVEFYLAKHNYEPDLNGIGRELIVRKDCYSNYAWGSYDNTYISSYLNTYQNSVYKGYFDSKTLALIGETKIQYTAKYDDESVSAGAFSFFSLSVTEFGLTAKYANTEGSALPIANTLLVAYKDGSAIAQWTRSPNTVNNLSAYYLTTSGTVDTAITNTAYGSRPAFTLPSTAKVDDTGLLIG